MDFIEVGRILKPHGVRGALKVLSYLENQTTLAGLADIFIKKGNEGAHRFKISRIKSRGNYFFLELKGIADMDAAQLFTGSSVLIPADKLKKLPEGEYYWRDLIGLEVFSEEGQQLGRIESIFPTTDYDVYVCKGKNRELLLPAVSEIIKEINLKRGRIKVHLIEGL